MRRHSSKLLRNSRRDLGAEDAWAAAADRRRLASDPYRRVFGVLDVRATIELKRSVDLHDLRWSSGFGTERPQPLRQGNSARPVQICELRHVSHEPSGVSMLNRLQCVGVGAFDLEQSKVTYDIYANAVGRPAGEKVGSFLAGLNIKTPLFVSLAGLLLGNFRAFFAGFRESYGDSLLAALYSSSFAAFARAECPFFSTAHCAGDCFTCGLAVSSPA